MDSLKASSLGPLRGFSMFLILALTDIGFVGGSCSYFLVSPSFFVLFARFLLNFSKVGIASLLIFDCLPSSTFTSSILVVFLFTSGLVFAVFFLKTILLRLGRPKSDWIGSRTKIPNVVLFFDSELPVRPASVSNLSKFSSGFKSFKREAYILVFVDSRPAVPVSC